MQINFFFLNLSNYISNINCSIKIYENQITAYKHYSHSITQSGKKMWGGGRKEYRYFFKGKVPFDLQSLVLSTVVQGQPYHYA